MSKDGMPGWQAGPFLSSAMHVAACSPCGAVGKLLPSWHQPNSNVPAIGSAHFFQPHVYSPCLHSLVFNVFCVFCCAAWSRAAGCLWWERCTMTIQTSTSLHVMTQHPYKPYGGEEELFCVISYNCINSAVQNGSTNILAVLWKSLCPFSYPLVWVGRKLFQSDSE